MARALRAVKALEVVEEGQPLVELSCEPALLFQGPYRHPPWLFASDCAMAYQSTMSCTMLP